MAGVKNDWQKKGPKKVLHGARLKGGGGSKAIWAMPIWNQHISKRDFPLKPNSFKT